MGGKRGVFPCMPVSLLTPIAIDLGVSEGHAGQAISISGAFALITSLCISSVAGRLDRKRLLLSLTLGFSQVMYHLVHNRHHSGNMDRPDADGNTIDFISIYKHGTGGAPENAFKYFLMSYFRDDPVAIYKAIKARQPVEAKWAVAEIVSVVALYGALALYDWRAVLCLLPFYWLGHSLSAVNGYYEHYRANPDQPIAWGVSSYNKLYNWTWMNNGYHAEHHYRPKLHWTKMADLHREIAAEQKKAGVHVIAWPHVLGFLADELLGRGGDFRVLGGGLDRTVELIAAALALQRHLQRAEPGDRRIGRPLRACFRRGVVGPGVVRRHVLREIDRAGARLQSALRRRYGGRTGR